MLLVLLKRCQHPDLARRTHPPSTDHPPPRGTVLCPTGLIPLPRGLLWEFCLCSDALAVIQPLLCRSGPDPRD